MISYKTGSIFDSTAQCIVNPVNCVGIMGKGLALEFKHRYPKMLLPYRTHCKNGDLRPGVVQFWADGGPLICLFPTKFHFREKSTVQMVNDGLKSFTGVAPILKISSVAFPKLGCGLGGLDWVHQIRPLMERYFAESELNVEVYV